VTRTPLSRSKGQRSPGRFTHRGLTRQAAAAVSVGTYWVWETTATLWCARRREALGGASAPTEGGKGWGNIVAAARLCILTTSARLLTRLSRNLLQKWLFLLPVIRYYLTGGAQFLNERTQSVGHSVSIQITRCIIHCSGLGPYAFLSTIADLKTSHQII